MQKLIPIIAVIYFVAFSFPSFSQLQVTPNNNASQLAQTLAGAGVIVSGATLNCPNSAGSNPSGTFVGTASNIGIAGGVLLTTGDIINAVGPNSTDSKTTSNGVTFSDPDLIVIEPQATRDVCILEFDVKPSCDTLAFTYAFGSEEYPEFVNSTYNDAFGIFVTGTNPSGPAYTGYNMALLPATTTPVSINNVNNGLSYSCPTTGPCKNCAYYVDNCANGPPSTVEYDGFTKPITVKLSVVPCGIYHLKLAIADAGDDAYDSGVFFALQSLKCNTTLAINTSTTPSACTANNGSAAVTNVVGGTAPYTYSWSSGQTTSAVSGLAPGNYTVTAIDANGCLNGMATVIIASTGGFTATPAQTNATCFGNTNASASVIPTGGNIPYTYSWSIGQTTSAISGIAAGNYTCVITDGTGCINTMTFSITEPTAVTYSTSSTPSACTANNGSATVANVVGGTAPYTYSWNSNPVQNTQTASNLAPGNYIVSVIDNNGCMNGTATVTIAGTGGFAVTSSQTDVTCFGNNNGLASVSVTPPGSNPPYTYAWSTTPMQTSPTISNIPAGNYSVVVVDATGCMQTATYTIIQPPAIIGSITNATNVSCFGGKDGSATVSGSGGTGALMYTWNSSPVQTTPTAVNLDSGIYFVTIKDANGCVITQSVTITEPTGMTLSISATPTSCGTKTGTATVSPSGGAVPYTYLWLTNPVQTLPTASGLASGTYTVIVSDANGCNQPKSASIGGGLAPVANFNINPDVVSLLDPLVNFTDGSSGNPATWIWNFGDTGSANNSSVQQNPFHTYADTGIFCVTLFISDTSGACIDSIVKCLRVEAPFTFYIPNSFTPNNDGKNELFMGYGTCIKEFQLLIFDRWGNKIFESNDLYTGWNGAVNNKGNLVEEDVYVWKVRITDIYGKGHKYIGRVSLIK